MKFETLTHRWYRVVGRPHCMALLGEYSTRRSVWLWYQPIRLEYRKARGFATNCWMSTCFPMSQTISMKTNQKSINCLNSMSELLTKNQSKIFLIGVSVDCFIRKLRTKYFVPNLSLLFLFSKWLKNFCDEKSRQKRRK